MLTRKQHELLLYIHKHLGETGVSPSFEEMKDALDLKSKSGVVKMPDGTAARGPVPANDTAAPVARPSAANDVLDIPLHGRIAAGTPIEALQGQDTLPVPAALLGPGEHYALEVAGDSMVEVGILDGDYALVRKTDTARDGEIVVALINNEEATLKTFRREGQMIRLDPANRQYDPQRYQPGQVQIQGKLAGLLRRY
jgi:repressor LexA